jgi:hypothetical protein
MPAWSDRKRPRLGFLAAEDHLSIFRFSPQVIDCGSRPGRRLRAVQGDDPILGGQAHSGRPAAGGGAGPDGRDRVICASQPDTQSEQRLRCAMSAGDHQVWGGPNEPVDDAPGCRGRR